MSDNNPAENRIAQTHLFVGGKAYKVSTINRECSAAAAGGSIYAETIVWAWDKDKRVRGDILYMCSDFEGSVRKHIEVCGLIFKDGDAAIEALNNG